MRSVNLSTAISLWLVMICSAQAASFDCSKAKTSVEKMICADTELSKLDEDLAVAYAGVLKAPSKPIDVRNTQTQWLTDRNGCADSECMKRAYQMRLTALRMQQDTTEQVSANGSKPKEETEAAKALSIKDAIGQRAYKLTHTTARPFCGRILNALKNASPEISYIEPVLRTDEPTHPGLAKYHACDQYEGARGEFSFVLCAVGERRFRLYQFDVGRKGKNREVEYLYGQEPSCNQRAPIAQFTRVNLETCEVKDSASVRPETVLNAAYKKSFRDGSINALIKYRTEYFVVGIEDYAKGGKAIDLQGYDTQKTWFKNPPMCRWHSAK